MSSVTPLANQITDSNFLQANGFSFTIDRAPTLGFYGNAVNVPGFILPPAIQPSYLKEIPRPGTVMSFQDLRVRFLVDAGLENYMEIQKWMRGIGFPSSLQEIYDWQETSPVDYGPRDSIDGIFSDGTLTILNNINNPIFNVKFKDCWPHSLSDLQFDAQQPDVEYLTAEVVFKYTIYSITDIFCC